LLLLVIPNISEKQKLINMKGCEALKETINSQIYLYELKYDKKPTNINELVKNGFIKEEQTKCKSNQSIVIVNEEAKIE
ncbi:MAG: competence protein ComGC, partial [Bacilli bacterium]|nr:competence protein ComGC [Bacilli bacterium]